MDLHVNNILNDIKKDDIQAYLLTQFTNVEYLSGYKPTSFAFCIIKENPIIYASGMDMELAVRDSAIEVKKYESYELMINELKEEGIKNLAIEPTLPYSTYVRFRDDFDVSSKTYVDKQRMIKTDDEIAKITKATEIAQKSSLSKVQDITETTKNEISLVKEGNIKNDNSSTLKLEELINIAGNFVRGKIGTDELDEFGEKMILK